MEGDEDLISLLAVECCANPWSESRRGMTAGELAAAHGKQGAVTLLARLGMHPRCNSRTLHPHPSSHSHYSPFFVCAALQSYVKC
jgi:hypothetical protein